MKLEDKRRQDEILLEEEKKRKVVQSKNLSLQAELETRRREEDRRLKEAQMDLEKRSFNDERRQELIDSETKRAEELEKAKAKASDLQTLAMVENMKRKQELERKLVEKSMTSSVVQSVQQPAAGLQQLGSMPGTIRDSNPGLNVGLDSIQRRQDDALSPIRSSRPEVMLAPSATRFRGLHFWP